MSKLISTSIKTLNKELNFQNIILSKVSRSFALTIPLLPESLKDTVANCYLWCRISDNIEDDTQLTIEQKAYFHQQLIKVIQNNLSCQEFTKELLPVLSENTPLHEELLIKNIQLVLNLTNSLPMTQCMLVKECVITMNQLMPEFEKIANKDGLENILVLNKYCYAVAGIVGEVLTKLFCNYFNTNNHRTLLINLSRSFGQALQMTNILKDRWNDYAREISWLPKDFFPNHNISSLLNEPSIPIFTIGIKNLIKFNYQYLAQALNYVLLLPAKETGIRKFCLWAIGIAIATLKNINKNPAFNTVEQIKISKIKLKLIIFITDSIVKYNYLLKIWFKYYSYSLKN